METATVGAAVRKDHQCAAAQVSRALQRRRTFGGDEDQFLLESRPRREAPLLEGLRHESGLDLEVLQPAQQSAGRTGLQFDRNLRVLRVERRKYKIGRA